MYSCTGQGTQQPFEHVSGLTELLVPDCARGSFKNGAGHTGNMYPEGNEMALALEVIESTEINRVAKYGMPQLTFDWYLLCKVTLRSQIVTATVTCWSKMRCERWRSAVWKGTGVS